MTKFHFGNTADRDLLYLTQYEIADSFFYLETGETKNIFLSSLDIDAFTEQGNSELHAHELEPFKKNDPDLSEPLKIFLAKEILSKFVKTGPIYVPVSFPLDLADALREAGWQLEVVKNWQPKRELKTASEIKSIKETAFVTTQAFGLIEDLLKESRVDGDVLRLGNEVVTSEYLKVQVEQFLFEHACLNPAGIIISCGKDAAKPHHQGAGPIRPHESIVVDIFPRSRVNHYFADMTRTYVKGQPSQELKAMYTAVSETKAKIIETIKSGMKAGDLYEISAKSIEDFGFSVGEQGYMHSLGHGLGLDIHETPYLARGSEAVLKPGHVITIEPGLYYEDIGGVRIEDTILITEDGCENLTKHPENWIIL